MKTARWVPSFPRTFAPARGRGFRHSRGRGNPSSSRALWIPRFPNRAFAGMTVRKPAVNFHPFVRPGKACPILDTGAMAIPAQARPARGRGIHPRRGGSRTAPTMSPQARELLPRYALDSSLRYAPFGMTSLRRCAVLWHLVLSTQSVNELPDTYRNDISCRHCRVNRLPRS